MDCDVKDLKLAGEGKRRIDWADEYMPVLRLIRERFEKEQPLAGIKMSACLHITSETANLARTLKAGGAHLVLCASNPLSTQDDVAAAIVEEFGISVFAVRGEDRETYYKHLNSALDLKPDVTMDDGADLVWAMHSDRKELASSVLASMEETTTGVIRLRALAEEGKLVFPVFAVNDADCKHLFDNRYGTGQSTIDGILRATDILFAGRKFVVSGYGWCGRGVATRARGMGAHVIVTEVDPLRALEATMDGFWVMPMAEAARIGDVFVTVTGDVSVLRREHFEAMKDGAIVCNAGHFNVEINLDALKEMTTGVAKVREFVEEYTFADGRRIRVLAEGRLVNLAAAHGHPASVMDMSFAVQALTSEYAVKNRGNLEVRVYDVPREVDRWVARLKLECLGVGIDTLTDEQEKYLKSSEMGT